MATQLYDFQPGVNMLTPVVIPQGARIDAADFAVSKTFVKGQALGKKTSDLLLYPLDKGATDGTQNFVGFNGISMKTDANGKIYFVTGTDSAAAHPFALPMSTAPIWIKGTFDPEDLVTAYSVTTTDTAEVLTFTPASPTTGDIYTMYDRNGAVLATFTVAGTQTATATVTGLKAAWNANANAVLLAAASGTATLILTAVEPGTATGINSGVSGTGTNAKVITTAASGGVQGDVLTFTPGTVTLADVTTLTVTFPDLSTETAAFTTGATTTATAVANGLRTAWNANTRLANLAAASGTATFILTNNNLGSPLNVTGAVVGTGSITKVVTTAAEGRDIADILSGAPGARVLHNGFWDIP